MDSKSVDIKPIFRPFDWKYDNDMKYMWKLKNVLLLYAAFTVVSCAKNNDFKAAVPQQIIYAGDMSVTYQGQEYKTSGVDVEVIGDDIAKTLDLIWNKVKFVPQMPEVTVTIPDIAFTEKDGIVSFSGDGIVPLAGEVPYDRFMVRGLKGTVSGDVLNVSLVFGSVPTSFTGSLKK